MDGSRKSFDEATLIKDNDEFEKSNKSIRGTDAYPLLEIQSGPKQGAWFTLTHQKEVSLGRANVNSIVLEDNSVSRSHSVIHEVDGKFFIKDVGSRNGTYVNDKKIQEDFQLRHGDRVKVGIYVLRFLLEPQEEVFEEEKPAAPPVDERTLMDSESLQKLDASEKQEVEAKKEGTEDFTRREPIALVNPGPQVEGQALVAGAAPRKGKGVVVFLIALLLVGGMSYTIYRLYVRKKINVVATPTPPKVLLPAPENPTVPTVAIAPESQAVTAPAPETQAQVQAPVAENSANTSPIFLDVNATPLKAKIFYQNKELGLTPFKISVNVPTGTPQELVAVYRFEELGQEFSDKKSFTANAKDELVNVNFEGNVGTLLIKSLPKGVQVYLEASFATGQNKGQAVKLNDIVYNRPIYLPYGQYVVEMKKPESIEGSQNTVDVVKYHREFTVSADTKTYELNLGDQDLQSFPAKIKTVPNGAEVIVDGKKYGDTPYEGPLPLGKHQLILKKDGFYPHEQSLDLTMNAPFVTEVNLKTSEAGEFINKAREYIRQAQYSPAIEQLAEALKHNPSPLELGDIQLLLGNSYVKTGAFDVATGYFEKAKTNESLKGQADLGLAEANLGAGRKEVAVTYLINVMLNEKSEKVKSDAETLFHKVSPMKSVLLINTDPPGAQVSLNGEVVSQTTPIVLSDLSLGTYRLSVEKPGYKRYESRFQLNISTFKPIVVKLEALQ